jgi:hypothetical protein
MNRVHLMITMFVALSALLVTPSAHAASWVSTQPSVGNCVPYFMDGKDLAHQNHGITNLSGDRYHLTCPVTSQLGLVDATTVHSSYVYVYDGKNDTSAQAYMCITNPYTGSVSCGSKQYSGSSHVGYKALRIYPPSGTFNKYYPISIWVSLPKRQCTNKNWIGTCTSYRYSRVRSYTVYKK